MTLVAFILGFYAGASWLMFIMKRGPKRIFGKEDANGGPSRKSL